jgi:hypothetical protein
MVVKGALVIAAIIVVIAITLGIYASGMNNEIISSGGRDSSNNNMIEVIITSDVAWSAHIRDSESRSRSVNGFGDTTIPITCDNGGTYSLTIIKSEEVSGTLNVEIVKSGDSSQRSSTSSSSSGIISLSGTC